MKCLNGPSWEFVKNKECQAIQIYSGISQVLVKIQKSNFYNIFDPIVRFRALTNGILPLQQFFE